jgi:hypothetical protein
MIVESEMPRLRASASSVSSEARRAATVVILTRDAYRDVGSRAPLLSDSVCAVVYVYEDKSRDTNGRDSNGASHPGDP